MGIHYNSRQLFCNKLFPHLYFPRISNRTERPTDSRVAFENWLMASNVVPNFLSRNENSPPALIDPKFLSRSVRGPILTANPRLFRGYALQNDAISNGLEKFGVGIDSFSTNEE